MADIALISRFIEYLDSERNFSPHTVRSYGSDLLGYCRFLAAEGPTSELSADELPAPEDFPPNKEMVRRIMSAGPLEVRAMLAVLRNSGLSKSTIAQTRCNKELLQVPGQDRQVGGIPGFGGPDPPTGQAPAQVSRHPAGGSPPGRTGHHDTAGGT